MTTSSSTFRSIFIAALCIVLALPSAAFAKVSITKVMYDPQGADVGHEWIQITNNGTSTVNLAGYRLYEGGVNHKVTAVVGTSSISAGAMAVIVTDAGQYQADYPSFAGTIFKSSFSLSNTGETIALKDASLSVVDSYSYTAPPVVKTPPPAKAPKASKTSAKTSTTKSPSSYTYDASEQSASAASAPLPQLPALPTVWLYGFGLASLLILGVCAALYSRPAHSMSETSQTVGEFNIE